MGEGEGGLSFLSRGEGCMLLGRGCGGGGVAYFRTLHEAVASHLCTPQHPLFSPLAGFRVMSFCHALATHWHLPYRPRLLPPCMDPSPALDETLPVVVAMSVLIASISILLNGAAFPSPSEAAHAAASSAAAPSPTCTDTLHLLRRLPAPLARALLHLSDVVGPPGRKQNGPQQNAGAIRLCGLAAAVAGGRRAAALHSLPAGVAWPAGRGSLGGAFSFGGAGLVLGLGDDDRMRGGEAHLSAGGGGPSFAAASGGRGASPSACAESGGPSRGVAFRAYSQGEGDWGRTDVRSGGGGGGGSCGAGGVLEGSSSVGSLAGLLAACLASSLVPSAPAALAASVLSGLACRVTLGYALRLRMAATAATLFTVGVAGTAGGLAGMVLAPPLDAAAQVYFRLLGMPAEAWWAGGWLAAAAVAAGAVVGLGVKLASVCSTSARTLRTPAHSARVLHMPSHPQDTN